MSPPSNQIDSQDPQFYKRKPNYTPTGAPAVSGPCYLKFLIPDRIAGAVIGKGGSSINEMESTCGCSMKLSGSGVHFPNTGDRVGICGGESTAIEKFIPLLLQKISILNAGQSNDGMADGQVFIRLVVPNSTVSLIIGKGGESVKTLSAHTGAQIRASERSDYVNERLIELKGSVHSVERAVIEIFKKSQADPNVKEHVQLIYYQSGMSQMNMGGGGGGGYSGMNYGQGNYGDNQYSNQMTNAPGAGWPPALQNYRCQIEFNVPSSTVGAIIGKNGDVRNRMQSTTGSKILVSERSQDDQAERRVTISGTLLSIQSAQLMVIKQVIESQASQQLAAQHQQQR